jgi:hypothetical protein
MQNDRPFAWLAEGHCRRSALRLVFSAVKRGWMSGPENAGRRAALQAALEELMDDPATRPGELLGVARIYHCMGRPDDDRIDPLAPLSVGTEPDDRRRAAWRRRRRSHRTAPARPYDGPATIPMEQPRR